MNRTLEHILPRVQKPARYTGGEYNAVVKDRRAVDVRYALCFPDTYEIGMSNLGVRILYGLMNEMDGVWCERVFAPWGDMEEEMRREGIPLYGLESGDSIADFDLIGFSLGYEMAYTNVLNMLDLAGLPLRSGERTELSPIVVAGGTCAFNPEPLAPFVDLFVLGEGEDVSVEIIQLYRQAREEGWGKEEFLTAAARIPGVYVPSLYEVSYHGDGTVAAVTPLEGAPARVTKRIVQDFDKSYFPVKNCTLHRDRPRPGDAGGVPRLHPGLPLLSGGLRLPAGAPPQSPAAGPAGHRGVPGLRLPGDDPLQPVHQRLPGIGGAVRRPAGVV